MDGTDEIKLSSILIVLWRQKFLLFFGTILIFLVYGGLFYLEPVYRHETVITLPEKLDHQYIKNRLMVLKWNLNEKGLTANISGPILTVTFRGAKDSTILSDLKLKDTVVLKKPTIQKIARSGVVVFPVGFSILIFLAFLKDYLRKNLGEIIREIKAEIQ
ncbi:hypothetical protein ES708_00738 [subsurface metagenome]